TFSIHIFFFFTDTSTSKIYTLSLHDALPILDVQKYPTFSFESTRVTPSASDPALLNVTGNFTLHGVTKQITVPVRYLGEHAVPRSEEHTSELQSQSNLVCRLLLEKKKKEKNT